MKQITEDYVSFETARLLKEKGFSENTICKYAGVGGITEKWYDDYRERVLHFDWKEGYLIEPLMEPKDQYEIIGDTISAPTHQMALKWLREVHKICIVIRPYIMEDDICYCYETKKLHSEMIEPIKNQAGYTIYEQAVEAACLYVLKNLI